MGQIAREADRAQRAHARAVEAHQRAHARAVSAHQRETLKSIRESNRATARELTEETKELIAMLSQILVDSEATSSYIDLNRMIRSLPPDFIAEAPPEIGEFLPTKPGVLAKLIPGSANRYQSRCEQAKAGFEEAFAAHAAEEKSRLADWTKTRDDILEHNETVSRMIAGLREARATEVVEYFTVVLERFELIEGVRAASRVGFLPDSRHLVADYHLPVPDSIIPQNIEYTFSSKEQAVVGKPMPVRKRSALYGSVIAQMSLAAISAIFRAGHEHTVDVLTLNGMIEAIDPAKGTMAKRCILSVRVTRERFAEIDLTQVDPRACLKSLRASVSAAPDELVPVKPLLELDMVDPRFIESTDVLAGLDQRQNLMELTPSEFENLITNLFASMGLETRLTQASRDGGVDCVAYDQRPILGGKVVIQAKRYKHTVGVSAVRDLFGTMQNEGASKGILVTTSGYGKAAHDFAAGKPLELLDGANLLYLLAEHAGIEAKIIMPERWDGF
jgi:restriction system protein